MATVKKMIKVQTFTLKKELGEADKCPPQSKLIIDSLKAAGGKMTREELLGSLRRPPEEGGLKTVQTPERIVSFYKPRLEAAGILQVDLESKEIDVEVPDKPEPPAAGAVEGVEAGEGAKDATPETPANGKGSKGKKSAA